jgi:hypothetical protein
MVKSVAEKNLVNRFGYVLRRVRFFNSWEILTMKIILPAILAATMALPAAATTLRITITNTAQADGFALTPVYTALHNGDFDSYTPGETASAGLEQLAEVGNFGPIRDERIAATTGNGNPSVGAAFFGRNPDGSGRPLFGGESATVDIDVTNVATQRYFSFLSMVIPTNDLFVGNGNPLAFELFDSLGNFTGARSINVTGADIRDAGTEVNDRDFGVAFAAGQNGAAGPTENGVVTTDGFSQLGRYVGLNTAGGFEINQGLKDVLIDFANTPELFSVANISIDLAPTPVPLPATGLMLLSAIGAGGFVTRRKAKKA